MNSLPEAEPAMREFAINTVPDGYTDCVSDSQRYRMLGNGWTIDVIAYILSFAK